jgi:GntR family transcriptional regulator
MRLWLTRNGDIPVRDQLVTQLSLAILSGEIAPGARLPSTRELARRYNIHANTVSSAFRALEEQGWVHFKKGSGIYARAAAPALVPKELMADHLIVGLLRDAREHAIDAKVLRAKFDRWIDHRRVRTVLVVDKDESLRRILVEEVSAITRLPVKLAANGAAAHGHPDILTVALSADAVDVPHAIKIQLSSPGKSLADWLPAPDDRLIAVASGHIRFLEITRTFLHAAGFAPDSILVRDTSRAGWKAGLAQADAVVCDTLTAKRLPKVRRAIPFRLISESSLQEIRATLAL